MIIELTISGPIDAKKNRLKLVRGHAYYDAQTKANMLEIRAQLGSQWLQTIEHEGRPLRVPRPPLAHPAMACVFYVSQRGTRGDRDGKWTTVVDELVNVGVLKDDCIEDFNGAVLLTSAIRTDGWAGARVFIETGGSLPRLWRHLRRQDLGGWRAPNRFAKAAPK